MRLESVKTLVKTFETKDTCTEGHSIHVADLALKIAQSMGMNDRELELIEYAGLLHDIGKIFVPESILKKTTALNKYEWSIIKKHSIYSSQIIDTILNLRPIRTWVLYHHERWDGRGYPEGIKGDSIPLPARILSVCDTFSAMTSDRPYRRALNKGFALTELKKVAGSQLDSNIVKIFIGLEQLSEILILQEGRGL